MEPKKKAVDLAIIFGGKPGKGASKPPLRGSDDHEDESAEEDHDDLPPGFEAAAIEAFPDLDGDHDRLLALKRAISACTGSYDDE
ncbi:MAG: hypothetical protein WDO74_17950 [Pseudomonadota bacterium]